MVGKFEARVTQRTIGARSALAFITFVLVSWQFFAVVHAFDSQAHEGKLSCHLCQVQDRNGSSPPLESPLALLDRTFERPAAFAAGPQAELDRPVPTARGPPASRHSAL